MTFLDQCGRRIKKELLALLARDDWEQRLREQLSQPTKLICPLFAGLLNRNALVRWRSVSGFGVVIPSLAAQNMERARVVMRRLIWNLNEESGGIGWGCPEAMAETLATHPRLGDEFHRMFFSYIHEKEGPDNYLDHEQLRAGAFWGIARLAQARPDLAQKAVPDLLKALQHESSPQILGNICLALGLLQVTDAREHIADLTRDGERIDLYWDHRLEETTLGDLARGALVAMGF